MSGYINPATGDWYIRLNYNIKKTFIDLKKNLL